MDANKPLILISNDDGINAPGLKYLVEQLCTFAEIIVVAPDSPQSGKSSAITVETPLRLNQHNDYQGAKMFSVNGTPVDCVKLALHLLCDHKPDLMISGINHGSNSGNSVIYSGTMGAAMEATFAKIPSIGFSLLHHSLQADFSHCGPFIKQIVETILSLKTAKTYCLNVNIPAQCVPKGIKVTEASKGHWTEEYKEYTDPHGHKFYMLTGRYIDDDQDNPATDNYWLNKEYVTIVPVDPDQTDFEEIPTLNNLF